MEMEEIDAISELYPLSSLRFGEIGCILSNQDKNSVHLRGKYHATALRPRNSVSLSMCLFCLKAFCSSSWLLDLKSWLSSLGLFSMSLQTAGDRVPIKRRKEEEKGERSKNPVWAALHKERISCSFSPDAAVVLLECSREREPRKGEKEITNIW